MDNTQTMGLSSMVQGEDLGIGGEHKLAPAENGDLQGNFNNTLDLEPNPFEKSFARNEGPQGARGVQLAPPPQETKPQEGVAPEITVSLSSVSNTSASDRNNQAAGPQVPAGHMPAAQLLKTNSFGISGLVGTVMTPPVLTPGGTRRLPASSLLPPIPGVLSPGGSIIGTPGIWNTLFTGQSQQNIAKDPTDLNHPVPSTATLIDGMIQEGQTQGQQTQQAQQQQQQMYNMIMNSKKTGLTPNPNPNPHMMRTGLTPGGNIMSQFNQLNGYTSAKDGKDFMPMENGQVTPGLMSILAASNELGQHNIQPVQQVAQPPEVDSRVEPRLKRTRSVAKPKVEPEPEEELPVTKRKRGKQPTKKKATPAPTGGKKRKTGSSEQEKRQSFLERNRVAASKCRERKKQMIEQMKEDLKTQETENGVLRQQVDQLRDYALTLRSVMYAHRECRDFVDSVGGMDALNRVLSGGTQLVGESISLHTLPEFLKETPTGPREAEENDAEEPKSNEND